MSYILDALKKAAEQRSGPPAEVRRLLSPAPVAAISASRYVMLGIAAVGVMAISVIAWMWGSSPPPATPVASVVSVPAAGERVAASSPSPLAPPDPPRAVHTAEAQPDTPAAHGVPPAATATVKRAPRTTSADSRGAPAKTAVSDVAPPRTAPSPVVPAPAGGAAVPAPPAASRTDVAKLKVEVIVYSEQRPLRWVFISGRKYVEGDAIGDGARVEEIQSGGVVLVEDGRRFTLRP